MYLMCDPENFDISYQINPWMADVGGVNLAKAKSQWNFLKGNIESVVGQEVIVMQSQPGLPDLVFTANAGVIHKNIFIPSNFFHEERRGESKHFAKWFSDNGYDVVEIDERLNHEGMGDSFIYGDYLIGGHGFRTSKESQKIVSDILGLDLVAVKLKDPRFYHLDTCFSIVDKYKRLAIYYPGAFEESFVKDIENIGLELIPVSESEAMRFACNLITNHKDAIIMPNECPDITMELTRRRYNVLDINMTEFIKSGGACKCCVLEVP